MYKVTPNTHQRHDPNTYSAKRVMIVEDEQTMARTLASVFQELNFKDVFFAKDGREAVERLARNNVDLILSDWNMPRMTGLDLLIHVRNDSSLSRTPFIMISGNIDPVDVTMAIKAGVSEYIVKPYTKLILKDKIHKALTLPPRKNLLLESEKNASQEKQTLRKGNKRTILIVDDEPANLTLLDGLLKENYKVVAARSGKNALQICSKEVLPDLILLDIMMPEIDGLQVCKRLKADPRTEHIPIIFVSALAQDKDAVKGLTLGAVDYLTKPVIPEVLNARVNTHIKTVAQREGIIAQVDSLMENMRVRDEMERILQHDIRNPLSAIISATEQMEDKSPQCSMEIEVIKNASEVMGVLLNNKTMLSELENEIYKLKLQQVDIQELLQQICSAIGTTYKHKNINFRRQLSAAKQFIGDKSLLYILFYNLLNNAVEASPDNGMVSISCSLSENSEDLTFLIHNLGFIPEEIQSRFFHKFATFEKQGGSGIGAYTALLAAKALNGNITFTTSVEKGTTLKLLFHKIQ